MLLVLDILAIKQMFVEPRHQLQYHVYEKMYSFSKHLAYLTLPTLGQKSFQVLELKDGLS